MNVIAPECYRGTVGVLWGYCRGTVEVLWGYCGGTVGVLWGYCGGTVGVLWGYCCDATVGYTAYLFNVHIFKKTHSKYIQ